MSKKIGCVFCMAIALIQGTNAMAPTADQAWLKYPLDGPVAVPQHVQRLGNGPLERAAAGELQRGLSEIGRVWSNIPKSMLDGRTVVGTIRELRASFPEIAVPRDIGPDGYWLHWGQ